MARDRQHAQTAGQFGATTTERGLYGSDQRGTVEGRTPRGDRDVREVFHAAARQTELHHGFHLFGNDGLGRVHQHVGAGMSARSVGNCRFVAAGVIASPKPTSI